MLPFRIADWLLGLLILAAGVLLPLAVVAYRHRLLFVPGPKSS